MKNEKKEASALTKTYDLILWLIPQLEKFPKSQRFLLGDRVETNLLDIMELIIQAIYTKDKASSLSEANLKLEKLRYLIRLTTDLKYLSIKKYEYVSTRLNEIGSEIGGWLKYQKSKDEEAK